MVANVREGDVKQRYRSGSIETLLKAQVENSIELGWKPEDIILLTNFDFEFMGIRARKIVLNDFCFTGSKIFGLVWWFNNNKVEDVIWAHDLDCWQNVWFDCPEFKTDVGGVQYSNPKWNGGSIFWKPGSKDVVDEIVKRLTEDEALKEEPLLNKVFKSKEFRERITNLNSTYNVGCSGFIPRYERSVKPIRVPHFHPYNGIAWEMHALDREGLGEIAVTLRLERLLRRHYPELATRLTKRKKEKKAKK